MLKRYLIQIEIEKKLQNLKMILPDSDFPNEFIEFINQKKI